MFNLVSSWFILQSHTVPFKELFTEINVIENDFAFWNSR